MGTIRGLLTQSDLNAEVAVLATGFWSIYIFQYWVGAQTALVPGLWGWLNGYGFKVLALIAIGFAYLMHVPRRGVAVAIDVVATCCIEAGALALFLLARGGLLTFVPALVASSFVEVGFAWLIVQWGMCNAAVPLRSAFLAFIAGSLAVSVSKVVLAYLPVAGSVALIMIVAPLSTVLLVRRFRECPGASEPHDPHREEGLGGKFIGIAVAAAIFFLVWSYLNVASKVEVGHYGYGDTSKPSMVLISQLIAIVFFTVAYQWSFVLRFDIDLEGLWKAAFLWLAAAVTASAIFDFSLVSQAFTSAAFEAGNFLLYTSITAYCHHTRFDCRAVMAFGILPFVGAQWAVRALVGWVGVAPLDVIHVSLILMAILVTIVVLVPGRSPDTQLMASGLNGELQENRAVGGEDAAFSRLAKTYCLTDREAEVVRHLCYGRTKQYVAEAMCLSENTIRTYSRRAYQKLGVHNRGELQELVWQNKNPD